MRAHSTLFAVIVALSMGGCALTEDTVVLSYRPRGSAPQALEAAQNVTVSVVVRDERRGQDRTRISCKKNGYGIEMAAIRSANDVPTLVRDSIQGELTRRGFRAGPGGVTVVVELRRLYNDFKTGFFSGDAEAEAELEVRVYPPGPNDGSPPLYEGRAEGEGENPNVQLSSGENAKVALELAFGEAVWRLFADRRFIQAILTAGVVPLEAPLAPAPAVPQS